ncbi:hypothetical protein ACH5RR_004367 [Cinchona calisaya]|uniref:Uncharacterized protein n=1 Tax=Cinchona calisaya TaxID=153742 RepID=A0ABD3AXI4_9GENT
MAAETNAGIGEIPNLRDGELINGENFNLLAAVPALEIMHPKMESGIVSNYCSVDEAIEKGAAHLCFPIVDFSLPSNCFQFLPHSHLRFCLQNCLLNDENVLVLRTLSTYNCFKDAQRIAKEPRTNYSNDPDKLNELRSLEQVAEHNVCLPLGNC